MLVLVCLISIRVVVGDDVLPCCFCLQSGLDMGLDMVDAFD